LNASIRGPTKGGGDRIAAGGHTEECQGSLSIGKGRLGRKPMIVIKVLLPHVAQ